MYRVRIPLNCLRILLLTLILLLLGCEKDGALEISRPHEYKEYQLRKGYVNTSNELNRKVEFFYQVPETLKYPDTCILIIPGLNGKGDVTLRGLWAEFSEKSGVILISPTFLYKSSEWDNMTSFHFPAVWAGKAVDDMIEYVEKDLGSSFKRIFLHGTGGGDQFVMRYGLADEGRVRAISVHQMTSVVFPEKYYPIPFFTSWIKKDKDYHSEYCKSLVRNCHAHNIQCDFAEYENSKGLSPYPRWLMVKTFEFYEKVLKNEFKTDLNKISICLEENAPEMKEISISDMMVYMENIIEQTEAHLVELNKKDISLPSVKEEIVKWEKELANSKKNYSDLQKLSQSEQMDTEEEYSYDEQLIDAAEGHLDFYVDLDGDGEDEVITEVVSGKLQEKTLYFNREDLLCCSTIREYQKYEIVDLDPEDGRKEILIEFSLRGKNHIRLMAFQNKTLSLLGDIPAYDGFVVKSRQIETYCGNEIYNYHF